VDESAMTGESDELQKQPLEVCKARLEEHLEEEKTAGKLDRNSHSVPSPLMLSGTQIQTGEGWFMVIVVGKNSC
jgi:magnesium-transporting ATPase (P-type)